MGTVQNGGAAVYWGKVVVGLYEKISLKNHNFGPSASFITIQKVCHTRGLPT